MSTTRPVAVLIVAYRTPTLLRACLASLAEHLPELPVHVHDNSAAEAHELDDVVADHPDVRWHRGGPNIGFAAAVNALAATVPGHDLLLLNPDAVVLGPLTATLEAIRTPGVAAAAPLVEAGTDAVTARPWDVAHRARGVVRALVSAAGYAEKFRGTPLSELYPAQPDDVEGYLTGACLALSRDAWDAIGPFDEEYFLYGEESHWQQRAHDAGWQLVLADEIGIAHESAGTVAADSAASRRSGDLLRTNIALQIEHGSTARQADLYLAGTSVLDRLQRSKRQVRASAGATDRPAVVITINRLDYGGAERHHVVLATELVRRGHDVTIVAMQRFGPLIAEIPHGVRVVRQPWWAPAVDLPPGPSILITGDTNTETGFGTLWRRRHPDRRWLVGAHVPPDPDAPTYSAGLARAMRRADGFITLSPQHRADVSAHQEVARRWFIAPNGVAHETGLSDVAARAEVDGPELDGPLHDGPLHDGPLRLVMLSRIVELKNPHVLVEALDGLRDLDWTLDIFGDGPDRARLEALTPADLRDRVRWRGWSPGPDHAFADADLVCLPSRSEAFPLTILEAMARRLPVIASATCAVPDMLDHGRAGIVVDDVTVEGWRAALSDVMKQRDQLPALASRGLERMRDHYTIEAMADAYQDAIEQVLS